MSQLRLPVLCVRQVQIINTNYKKNYHLRTKTMHGILHNRPNHPISEQYSKHVLLEKFINMITNIFGWFVEKKSNMEKQIKLRIDLVIWDRKYCTNKWVRVPHIALVMSTWSHSTSSSSLQEEMVNNVTKQYKSNQNMSWRVHWWVSTRRFLQED